MRRVILLLALVAACPANAETLAIVHAEAWTMETSEPVRDATIVIEDGVIRSVAAGAAPPAGARVIDAGGKPVTPGLVNGATQLGLVEVSASDDTRDQASSDEGNSAFDVSRALNGNSTLVDLARADGLTRALIYPSPSKAAPFGGQAAIARLRDGVDILDRPNVAVHAVIGGGAWERLGSRGQQWAALRKALADARKDSGGSKAKDSKRRREAPRDDAHRRGGRPGGETLLREVLAGEVPLAIQTHRESDIRQAIALSEEFGIRVVIVGGAEAWRAADALAAAKIAVVLDAQANLPATFDQLGTRQDAAVILSRAGVPIAFGMAGGPIHMTYNAGMAVREGAGLAVANGLAYGDALRALTVSPLAIWGRGGGTLAPGSEADLVIWSGDPLEPSTNVLTVIIEGREASNRSRQDLLAERYRDAAR